jgi:hypothetical protein
MRIHAKYPFSVGIETLPSFGSKNHWYVQILLSKPTLPTLLDMKDNAKRRKLYCCTNSNCISYISADVKLVPSSKT